MVWCRCEAVRTIGCGQTHAVARPGLDVPHWFETRPPSAPSLPLRVPGAGLGYSGRAARWPPRGPAPVFQHALTPELHLESTAPVTLPIPPSSLVIIVVSAAPRVLRTAGTAAVLRRDLVRQPRRHRG